MSTTEVRSGGASGTANAVDVEMKLEVVGVTVPVDGGITAICPPFLTRDEVPGAG
jgi:hypothetical protein